MRPQLLFFSAKVYGAPAIIKPDFVGTMQSIRKSSSVGESGTYESYAPSWHKIISPISVQTTSLPSFSQQWHEYLVVISLDLLFSYVWANSSLFASIVKYLKQSKPVTII